MPIGTLNKNQKGFSIVGLLLVFVVVGLVAGAGWYVFYSRSNGSVLNTTCYSFSVPEGTSMKVNTSAEDSETRCDAVVAPTDAKDIEIASVIGYLTASGGFVEGLSAIEQRIRADASDITKSNITIDGLSAVKFTYQPKTTPYMQIFVLVDASTSKIDNAFESFSIEGHYHNDFFQSAFDKVLTSWKWQN